MADILARLKDDQAIWKNPDSRYSLCSDAAAEIERLRLVVQHEADCTQAADDEAMRRGHRIEELRAALTEIIKMHPDPRQPAHILAAAALKQ